MSAPCGTHAGYYTHRRAGAAPCEACMTAYRRYIKHWKVERERTGPRIVNGDEARAHVQRLLDEGMSLRSIGKFAGISASSISTLMSRPGTGINKKAAQRLLAVDGPRFELDGDSETFVPRIGAERRIKALLALGWTHAHMRAESGVLTAVLIHQAGEWVTQRNHNRVREMYDRLSMTPGPSSKTRARAARLGYLPPLAWDDDTIDRTDAWADLGGDDDAVDEVAVDRFMAGDIDWREVSTSDRLEAAIRLARLGYSRNDIEARVHVNRRRLRAALDAGRPLTHTEAEQWAARRREDVA